MVERPEQRIWLGRALYLLLCTLIMFVALLPLETTPRTWGSPDLLLLLTLAWATRRPGYVPFLLIGAVFLLADLLFHRPPGLWSALVLILSEALRARARSLRVLPYLVEWASIAVGIVAITLIYRFTLALVLVPQAPLGLTLIQMTLTILTYPFIALLSFFVFGVSRPAQGAVDSLGHRL